MLLRKQLTLCQRTVNSARFVRLISQPPSALTIKHSHTHTHSHSLTHTHLHTLTHTHSHSLSVASIHSLKSYFKTNILHRLSMKLNQVSIITFVYYKVSWTAPKAHGHTHTRKSSLHTANTFSLLMESQEELSSFFSPKAHTHSHTYVHIHKYTHSKHFQFAPGKPRRAQLHSWLVVIVVLFV